MNLIKTLFIGILLFHGCKPTVFHETIILKNECDENIRYCLVGGATLKDVKEFVSDCQTISSEAMKIMSYEYDKLEPKDKRILFDFNSKSRFPIVLLDDIHKPARRDTPNYYCFVIFSESGKCLFKREIYNKALKEDKETIIGVDCNGIINDYKSTP